MVRKFVALAFALLLIGPTAGAAQVSVGVGGQYLSLGGSDFDLIDAGFGGEGNVLFALGQSLKVGGSAQYSSHGTAFDKNLSVLGVFGEGRYMFSMGTGKATPYVAGRVGWVQSKANDVTIPTVGTGDYSGSGIGFGGGVGVMIGLTPSLGFDINAVFHSVSQGKAELKTSSGTLTDTETTSGTALQIRGGINFKLGGGNGGM